MSSLRPIDTNTKHQLNLHLEAIEQTFDADALTIISPIMFGLDGMVKRAVEQFLEPISKLPE